MTTVLARMAASTAATASPAQRTITGLAVPWDAVGHSALGDLTFARGSLEWGAPGRVKLLTQHDPERPIGFATALDDADDGLHATFTIPDSEEGNRALQEAADGRRDGLSVGVRLSAETVEQVMGRMFGDDDGDEPIQASGWLVEVSQVSLPAFDDARIPSAAAAGGELLTMSLHFQADTTEREPTMPAPTPAPPAPAAAEVDPAPAPTPSPFDAGHQIAQEAPVYTFDGRGPSFVRDMWRARFDHDPDAIERVQRFNQRWTDREPAQMERFLTAAVEVRPSVFIPQPYRPDLLVEAIDKGRPLVSRIGTVALTDATPFRLPVEGEMTGGVGTHTEGTAHVAEGDSAVSDVTVTPGAISGAFRLSRELVDASNPAIDQIALRQMMRLYRTDTETKVVAALEASDSTATASINTVIEVRQQINAYYDAMFEDPTGIAASPSYVATLLSEVDSTGRAMLASVNPQNALGTGKAGATGASVDGVELHKAWAVAATMAYLYNAADVFIGESAIQTFRFEEVEGPGVIKLALWSYFAAKVTRAGSVVKVTTV